MANMSRTPLSRLTGMHDPDDLVRDRVSRHDLQKVESELEAVVASQLVETREVTQLKEVVQSLRDDLSTIKDHPERNAQRGNNGRQRKKIPPLLSVSVTKR